MGEIKKKKPNIYESFDNIFYPASEKEKFREIIRQEVREAIADILIKPSEEKKWREYYDAMFHEQKKQIEKNINKKLNSSKP
tara:strand:- start:269 stop:514 length:246 start_codon:yes stop_codon:yes gene_type:complete